MCDCAAETKISESAVFPRLLSWSGHKMTCLQDWHGNQIAKNASVSRCCEAEDEEGSRWVWGPFHLAGRRCFLSFSLWVLCTGPSVDTASPRSAYQCCTFHRRADWGLPGRTSHAFSTVSITLCVKASLWKRRCFCRYQEAKRISVPHWQVIDWGLVITLWFSVEKKKEAQKMLGRPADAAM